MPDKFGRVLIQSVNFNFHGLFTVLIYFYFFSHLNNMIMWVQAVQPALPQAVQPARPPWRGWLGVQPREPASTPFPSLMDSLLRPFEPFMQPLKEQIDRATVSAPTGERGHFRLQRDQHLFTDLLDGRAAEPERRRAPAQAEPVAQDVSSVDEQCRLGAGPH